MNVQTDKQTDIQTDSYNVVLKLSLWTICGWTRMQYGSSTLEVISALVK